MADTVVKEIDPTQRLQSLERGLSVLSMFDSDRKVMSMAEIAAETELSRATVRRIVLTLEEMGFVEKSGRKYCVTPRVLTLSKAFLPSETLWQSVEPLLDELVSEIGESCSISILNGQDIRYVARSLSQRILNMDVQVGTLLPALPTSMGRTLLADVSAKFLNSILLKSNIEKRTKYTVTDTSELLTRIAKARELGYATVDQELEEGLISIAVPIRDFQRRTIASLGVSSHTGRYSCEELPAKFLKPLQAAVREIEQLVA